jgi:pyridinium-3,5-biscarboxylic acid mononucleotide sulfurtransferase
MTEPTQPDADRLIAILRSYRSVAVALSGGVDSAVVAKAACLALGERAVAMTADSPSVARADLEDAKQVAAAIGIRHVVLPTREFDRPDYVKNDGARCYFCKSELYDRMLAVLPEWNLDVVCSGANLDDLGDYRPGLTAAAERHVRHPLQEAKLGKSLVRDLAKVWGLPVWDKPASPCLSSRLAPGLAVTAERTAKVEAAERYLKSLGLADCRVRLHEGELARIEVPVGEVAKLAVPEVRNRLTETFRRLGFQYITLDLEGFRSGSLNDLVDLNLKRRFGAPAS